MRVPWNEDMRVKFPATVQFMRLGYEYQSLKDTDERAGQGEGGVIFNENWAE